jgi:predicted Rossmann fold nucleotide-binding protein DprA/Smf involved in DNA uptake
MRSSAAPASVSPVAVADPASGRVWRGQWGYPTRLADTAEAPLALCYRGPIELVGAALAICGPPDAGPAAFVVAREAARLAVLAGYAVASGSGRGVDIAVLNAAGQHGGVRVRVLAEGIRHSGREADGPGSVVVSQFPPERPWSVGTALASNATLAGLCDAMVVVAAASVGSALDAGMRALALGRPVLAVGDTLGSRLLVDYGAAPARDALELGWWLGRLREDRHRATPPERRLGTRAAGPRPAV